MPQRAGASIGASAPRGPRLDKEALQLTREKASHNLRDLVRRLRDPKTSLEEKTSLLLGMREKFWHAPAPRMIDMLERVGVAKDILDIVTSVIPRKCKRCMQCAHAKPARVAKDQQGGGVPSLRVASSRES